MPPLVPLDLKWHDMDKCVSGGADVTDNEVRTFVSSKPGFS